jgi:Domain of unknown function (DUF4262)
MESTMAKDLYRAEFDRETFRHIAQYGRSIIGVSGCGGEPPFSYTIGNHLKNLPELLIIGSSEAFYLNHLSRLMITRRRSFDDGELIQLLPLSLPLALVRVDDRIVWDEYTVQAGVYFGDNDYAVMQAVRSDKQGRFPDQSGCDPPWSLFPILRVNSEVRA